MSKLYSLISEDTLTYQNLRYHELTGIKIAIFTPTHVSIVAHFTQASYLISLVSKHLNSPTNYSQVSISEMSKFIPNY